MRGDTIQHSRGRMRSIETALDRRASALYALHDFVEFLYDFVPEHTGRYVVSLQAWDCNACPIWVGERIAQHFNHISNRLEDIMAARKGTKPDYQKIEYEFVKGELSTDQKAEAKIWIDKNGDDYAPLVGDLLASDYKLSMSYDSYNDTFVISLTGKPDNKYNAGKILTGRGRTWYLGLMSVLFKHNVVFNSGTWRSDSAIEGDDFS